MEKQPLRDFRNGCARKVDAFHPERNRKLVETWRWKTIVDRLYSILTELYNDGTSDYEDITLPSLKLYPAKFLEKTVAHILEAPPTQYFHVFVFI